MFIEEKKHKKVNKDAQQMMKEYQGIEESSN
jgi:hypothetical protein